MHIFIDKENIKAIIKSKDIDVFHDCIHLIKKNMDIHYNFPKSEIIKDTYLQAWFRSANGQGVENCIKYSESESERIPCKPFKLSDVIIKDKNNMSSIYLLEDYDLCRKISTINCLLMKEVGSELELFSRLIKIEDKSEIITSKIKNWKDFLPNLPLTDIVLCDPYYFARYNVYNSNNNSIIKVLASKVKGYPLKIVIMTHSKHIDSKIDLEKEQEVLQDQIRELTDCDDSSVTIVETNDDSHDRNLVTNYYRIKSGSGFQIFRNGVKDDVTTDIKLHTKRQNEQTTLSLLKTYENLAKGAHYIYGSGKSDLINF